VCVSSEYPFESEVAGGLAAAFLPGSILLGDENPYFTPTLAPVVFGVAIVACQESKVITCCMTQYEIEAGDHAGKEGKIVARVELEP